MKTTTFKSAEEIELAATVLRNKWLRENPLSNPPIFAVTGVSQSMQEYCLAIILPPTIDPQPDPTRQRDRENSFIEKIPMNITDEKLDDIISEILYNLQYVAA